MGDQSCFSDLLLAGHTRTERWYMIFIQVQVLDLVDLITVPAETRPPFSPACVTGLLMASITDVRTADDVSFRHLILHDLALAVAGVELETSLPLVLLDQAVEFGLEAFGDLAALRV